MCLGGYTKNNKDKKMRTRENKKPLSINFDGQSLKIFREISTGRLFSFTQVPFNRSLALKNAKETMELNKSAHLSCADTFTAWWIGPANLSGSTVEKELEIGHPLTCTLQQRDNRGAVPILRLDLMLTSTATD